MFCVFDPLKISRIRSPAFGLSRHPFITPGELKVQFMDDCFAYNSCATCLLKGSVSGLKLRSVGHCTIHHHFGLAVFLFIMKLQVNTNAQTAHDLGW